MISKVIHLHSKQEPLSKNLVKLRSLPSNPLESRNIQLSIDLKTKTKTGKLKQNLNLVLVRINMEMTSSSDATRSSLSDGTLDNLHKGMVCAYNKKRDDSSDSNDETLDNPNNKPIQAGSDDYFEESATITRRRKRLVPEELVRAEPQQLPSSYDQKDLMSILMNIQTQQDTLLKEIREIKDTQREIQRDLVRLKGSSSDGDLSVSGLNYDRRARYSIRPMSIVHTGIQEMPNSESSYGETNEEDCNIRL
ncbi:uncharacterized protein LOC124270105 isoform X1 [Haliotis rubra]|uniref:uncharacterized protein LOC124270105 isoform X1 n=1 Tax=Haliotis rubra TaxID=36100 RepID=UPI001EE5D0B5|nr:uncharacterized protein LOC124270105 isoform X1 [Haliotis rubra]